MTVHGAQFIKPSQKNNRILPFILCLPSIFLYFLLMTLSLKIIFIAANWKNLRTDGLDMIAWAILTGLRFDIAILAYLFIPALVFYYALAVMKKNLMKWFLEGYFIAMALFIQLFWLADIQYFEEAGKHMTHEAFAYLGISLLPILSGAFKLHPWLSTLSLLSSACFAFLTGLAVRWCFKRSVPYLYIKLPYYLATLIL